MMTESESILIDFERGVSMVETPTTSVARRC